MKWKIFVPLALLIAGLIAGCTDSTSVMQGSSQPMVNLSVSFSKSVDNGLVKAAAPSAVDSIRIDSAIVVFSRIKFENHIDTVMVDTTEHDYGDMDHMDRDSNFVFRGPFIVHVRDTVAIDLGSQVLPAGTYDGIKFKIHRIKQGEPCQDSDRRHGQYYMANDTSIVGSSITVWGAVYKDSGWVNFVYRFNGELEFKIKGDFTVPVSTSTVNIVLNFNMGSWFVNPYTGGLLDPTNTSFLNMNLIRRAIYISFGKGKGGYMDWHDHHGDN